MEPAVKVKMSRLSWTPQETLFLINIFHEKSILKLFEDKKCRRADIFKLIEHEFKQEGFTDKCALSIENKWKNMKKQFMAAKRRNSQHTFHFYDELEQLLESGPVITKVEEGVEANFTISEITNIDESSGTNQGTYYEDVSGAIYCGGGETDTANIPSNLKTRKRANVLKLDKGSIDYFFEKQKRSAEEDSGILSNKESELINKFSQDTRKVLEDSNRDLLNKFLDVAFNKREEASSVELFFKSIGKQVENANLDPETWCELQMDVIALIKNKLQN